MFATPTVRRGERVCLICSHALSASSRRYVSINSAVQRGLRQSANATGNFSYPPSKARDLFKSDEVPDKFVTWDGYTRAPIPGNNKSSAPSSIPYSTAASVFIPGVSAVTAALKGGRRKFYKLYVHPRARREGSEPGAMNSVEFWAKKVGMEITRVDDSWLPKMDQRSSGRPHNGCLLEASPLPQQWITRLGQSSVKDGVFEIEIADQSREELDVNGTETAISYTSDGWRHPFILYLDGVTDEGNYGAIIRSAYFLGVDAIVSPGRGTASLSNVTLKAASGAAEGLTMFKTNHPIKFMELSKKAGWRIYAAAVPTQDFYRDVNKRRTGFGTRIVFTQKQGANAVMEYMPNHRPLLTGPTVLILGNEGFGVSHALLRRAKYHVGISPGRDVAKFEVDSLNVSTSAAVLCQEFMRLPENVRELRGDELLF